MRLSFRLLPIAVILLILSLLWFFVSPCVCMAQQVGRSGTFTLLGTLTYVDGRPVAGKDVDIQKVNEKGEIVFMIVDGNIAAGHGKTDDTGHFRIEVDRKYFGGDPIRFSIRVSLGGGSIPQFAGDKGGIFSIFVVDDQAKVMDLDKLGIPLTVRTK